MPIKLNNPPIIEAVLDIDCEFKSPLDIKDIEAEASKLLAKQYPKKRAIFLQNHKFEPNEYSVKSGLTAYQFLKNDEKQLVQYRTEGFSFNRLAPYTSLDDYLPQIKKHWEIFRKLTNPIQIKAIRLRYINRFFLPLRSGEVKVGEYLAVSPLTADRERLVLLGFMDQYIALDKKTKNQVRSVITHQLADNDKLPVIFDNSVIAPFSGNPENWNQIRKKIIELRELKNHVFQKTLTKKCLKLFT